MIKVTKEERTRMLDKTKEALKILDDLMDFEEIRNSLTGRNDDADYAVWRTFCFLNEVLELTPEDPADDPVEEEDEEA